MDKFKLLLHEINENINNVIIFNIVIKAAIMFLSFYLLLTLFNMQPLYALVPSVMYMLVKLYLSLSKSKAKMVERNYPSLREKLTTAYEYRNVENPVVNELKDEI